MGDRNIASDEFGRFAERLLAQRRVRAALIVLTLLFAAAIYAPLVANDRPYVIESVEIARYEDARRSLEPVLESMSALIARTRAEFDGERGAAPHQNQLEAIAAERRAAENRLAILRAHLLPADRELLDACAAATARACEAQREGRTSEASEESSRAVALAREIRRDLVPADPGRPEAGGKVLQSRVGHPLFGSLSPIEVFFMVLWAIVITCPAWNRPLDALLQRTAGGGDRRGGRGGDETRVARARLKKLALVLGIPLASALMWVLVVRGHQSLASANYKSAIARGEILVRRAVFPPFAMGFAETNLAEANRPPTWTAGAEISAEGYYVHGSRAPRPDPSTGFIPPPRPVEVRAGEYSRNAPLRHPLGTDALGRDLLVRLMWGGRTSLSVGLCAALLLSAIGLVVGSVAGYSGGRIDLLASRAIEIVLCVPAFFLILSVTAFTDPKVVPPIFAIVIVIACVGWTGVARLVRAEFLRLRELEFVLAARAMGYSPARIVMRHMLPNALGPVLVAAAFAVASSTLYESTLSFLGLGVSQPIPSWGALINDSLSVDQWWIQVFPGLCLFATVLSYNLLGEGIREALDPRSATRSAA